MSNAADTRPHRSPIPRANPHDGRASVACPSNQEKSHPSVGTASAADWGEIVRVLRPGGTYFAQHVGPSSAYELVEHFTGPLPEESHNARHPDRERAGAEAAGLEIVELRAEQLRVKFFDIGAVVHFLKKVVWMVPGFTVDAYLPQLRSLHERIESEGPFVAHSSRHLFEARKPVS